MRALMMTLCLALCLASAYTAPLPKVKPTPPAASPVGVWAAKWNGSDWRMTFHKDGFYACEPGGWQGRWTAEGDTLSVTETSESGHEVRWTVTLEPGKLSGKLSSGGAFSLVRPKPDL